jgi:hypothetical protein
MGLRVRRSLGYANVTATLALVFAMSGGALAANHYLINSTKQINPKVLKVLKGDAGKTGASGPTGAAGATGATGAAGSPGKEGPEGKTGKEGPEGKTGAPGATDAVTRYGGEESVSTGGEGGSYAACESGEAVTGGGYDFTEGPANGKFALNADRPSDQGVLILDRPASTHPDLIGPIYTHLAPSNGAQASGWFSSVKNETGSSLKIRSYVLCASP